VCAPSGLPPTATPHPGASGRPRAMTSSTTPTICSTMMRAKQCGLTAGGLRRSSPLGGAGYETIVFVHTGDCYAPHAVVRDVAAFVAHMDTEPVRLLGLSQGAAVAQEVALLRPDLVAAAALVAAYGRQNSIDRLLQAAWAAEDAAGPELTR
jgi:pimeloyl-ACP methyl ester carboxylesterase